MDSNDCIIGNSRLSCEVIALKIKWIVGNNKCVVENSRISCELIALKIEWVMMYRWKFLWVTVFLVSRTCPHLQTF